MPNPHNNPYEGIGLRHNELVTAYYSSAHDTTVNDSTLAFNSTDLTIDEQHAMDSVQHQGLIDMGHWVNNNPYALDSVGYAPFISYCFQQGDTLVTNTLKTLLSGINNVASRSAAMSLINDYEAYFMQDQSITDEQQTLILIGLAVAKHSYALWYDAGVR